MPQEGNNFTKDNFLLLVRREMLGKFNSVAVFIDSTHNTSAYNLYQTTTLVIDEYGGVPVEWSISNRTYSFTFLSWLRSAMVHVRRH